MITLYDKSETSFEHNGIGSLEQDIIDPKIHWIDNGVFSFEFEYPLFAKHGLEITNSSIIKARDPEQDNLFFVYKVIPSMGYIKVYCYHIFYKLAFNTINDTNIVGKNGQGALTQLSGATQYTHKFQLTSDLTTSANSRVVRKNPVEILLDSNLDNSFINRWGGHIIRHGFNISMNQSYGSNKGYKIQHKKDLMGYEATIDETTVVTRIRPVGYDGLLLPEIYVDSPLINHYPEPRIQEYAYSDVKIGKGEGEFATAALAYAELRRLAKLEFSQNKIDVPRGIYKVDFVNLKETEEYKNFAPLKQILPGDIVAVEHEEDGINISSQMVEYNWDPLLKEYIDLTLGNYERSFTSTVNKLDKIQTDIKDIHNQIELVYLSADGKNKIYSGEIQPIIDQNSTEGDLWFKKNGDKTELWILRTVNGVLQWVVELSDATQEELKAAVNNAILQADKDRTKAEQEINQALIDAKNYTEVKAQEFDNQLLIVNQNVLAATNSANAAVLKTDKAVEDVGFMQVDVNTAKGNAATAIQNANTAIRDSSTAIQNAQTALNSVATLSQEVDVSITNINGELTRKVSQTTFNTLSGTVGTHTTQIGQTQNALLAKAESSLVNTIKGTVDTHTTQIKVASDVLELKADSSLVNTVKGTVDSHSSLISANAQAINARLTSTQIETLLTGKQYVNQTTLNATSSGLTAQITQVSTDLSNLKIGGRNLLKNSQRINMSPNNTGLGTTVYKTDESTPYMTTTGNSNISTYGGDGNDNSSIFAEKPIVGETYTISVDVRVSIASNVCFYGGQGLNNYVSKINEWVRIEYTYIHSLNKRVIGLTYSKTIIDHRNWKIERGNKATDWSPSPEDMATLEKVVTIEANIDGINTLVASKASQTQVTQLAGQITTKVESATYNSKMTQLDSAINLRVAKVDLISQINVQADNILIQTGNLYLDVGSVTMTTAYITDLKAKSLEAVYADIATLKTKVLTADVITSTQLKADTALITKLFATDANVNVLTAKSSFINSVKAIDIAADRITAGTLNAALVTIINLDASRIVSGTMQSITIRGSVIYASEFRQDDTSSSANTLVQILKTGAWFSDITGANTVNIDKDGIRLGGTSVTGGATRITSNAIYLQALYTHNLTTTGATTLEYVTFNQQATFLNGLRFGGSTTPPGNARTIWFGTIGGATGLWCRQFDSSTVWKRFAFVEEL